MLIWNKTAFLNTYLFLSTIWNLLTFLCGRCKGPRLWVSFHINAYQSDKLLRPCRPQLFSSVNGGLRASSQLASEADWQVY